MTEANEIVTSRGLPSPDMRRALRREAQLRLEDVAAAIGVTRSAVSRWETGKRTPMGRNRTAYSQFLNELESLRHA